MQTNNFFYFIGMEPIRSYFLGGENTFNTVEPDRTKWASGNTKTDSFRTNYFSKSRLLPQQTAILGMLRHALLMHNKGTHLLEASGETKAEIVGKQSFKPGYTESFGYIEGLSPVFLYRKDKDLEHWLPAGFNHQLYKDKNIPAGHAEIAIELVQNNNGKSMLNGGDTLPLLQAMNHNYKEETKTIWKCYDSKGNTNAYTEGDIFKNVTKVGVKKSDAQNAKNEEAYYKQTFRRLDKDFAFGVYLTSNKPLNITESFFMPFGADQSEFKIRVKQVNDIPDYLQDNPIAPNENVEHQFVLLSDAYVAQEARELCSFMITQPEDFRFIYSEVDKVNVYRSGAVNKHPRKINLLKRGSVLYTSQPAKLASILTGAADTVAASFRRIGYNYFIIKK